MTYSESVFPKMSEVYNFNFNLEPSPFLLALVQETKGSGATDHALFNFQNTFQNILCSKIYHLANFDLLTSSGF